MAKNVNFGSDTHISDAKKDPFNRDFWARCFHISETQRCSNKRKITGKTASVFFFYFFGKIQGRKSQLMNLALCTRVQIAHMNTA